MKKNDFKKLQNLLEKDQSDIKNYMAGELSLDDWKKCIKKRTEFIKELLESVGIPTYTNSNQKTYKAMLVLVLHSEDVKLMKKYLFLHKREKEGSVPISDRAFLVDKIRILENKKQLYGTQFKKENDKIVFLPIETENKVDERRADIGLESLEKYKTKILNNKP